jgi:hypothetical protein
MADQTFRQELLFALRAARTLPPEHDEALVDALLRGSLHDSPARYLRSILDGQAVRALCATAAVVGFTGVVYAHHQLQVWSAMYSTMPQSPAGSIAAQADPFLAVAALCLVVLAAGGWLSGTSRHERGYAMILTSTALLVPIGFVAGSYTGPVYLASIVEQALNPGAVTLLIVGTIVPALAACAAGARSRRHGRPTVRRSEQDSHVRPNGIALSCLLSRSAAPRTNTARDLHDNPKA